MKYESRDVQHLTARWPWRHAQLLEVPAGLEVRRLRIDPWRLVYAISETEGWVWLLALRRRPPYDHDDLLELLKRVERR